jgi:hypothetical protein
MPIIVDLPVLAFLSEYGCLGGGLLNNVRHGEGGGGAARQRPHVHHAQDIASTVPKKLTANNHCENLEKGDFLALIIVKSINIQHAALDNNVRRQSDTNVFFSLGLF